MVRDNSIDILRFWGLSLIILAHVNPPEILFHIRCFDVPLMLFVSGLAYSNKKADFSLKFIWHRFKRLVFPVWLFLTGYFTITAILKYFIGVDFGIRFEHVWGSFLLYEGIGYVWIIRVFLLVGLLTPFLLTVELKICEKKFLLCYVLALFILQFLISNNICIDIIFIRDYVYYAIGYSLLFIMGLHIKKASYIYVILILVAYIIIYVCITRTSEPFKINNFKYPPQTIYIIYGTIMSIISYKVVPKLAFLMNSSLCKFIGMNTIWIYLYHIPFIQLTGRFASLPWWGRYVIVYLLAVVVCYLQTRFVDYMLSKHKKLSIYKYLKG